MTNIPTIKSDMENTDLSYQKERFGNLTRCYITPAVDTYKPSVNYSFSGNEKLYFKDVAIDLTLPSYHFGERDWLIPESLYFVNSTVKLHTIENEMFYLIINRYIYLSNSTLESNYVIPRWVKFVKVENSKIIQPKMNVNKIILTPKNYY